MSQSSSRPILGRSGSPMRSIGRAMEGEAKCPRDVMGFVSKLVAGQTITVEWRDDSNSDWITWRGTVGAKCHAPRYGVGRMVRWDGTSCPGLPEFCFSPEVRAAAETDAEGNKRINGELVDFDAAYELAFPVHGVQYRTLRSQNVVKIINNNNTSTAAAAAASANPRLQLPDDDNDNGSHDGSMGNFTAIKHPLSASGNGISIADADSVLVAASSLKGDDVMGFLALWTAVITELGVTGAATSNNNILREQLVITKKILAASVPGNEMSIRDAFHHSLALCRISAAAANGRATGKRLNFSAVLTKLRTPESDAVGKAIAEATTTTTSSSTSRNRFGGARRSNFFKKPFCTKCKSAGVAIRDCYHDPSSCSKSGNGHAGSLNKN